MGEERVLAVFMVGAIDHEPIMMTIATKTMLQNLSGGGDQYAMNHCRILVRFPQINPGSKGFSLVLLFILALISAITSATCAPCIIFQA